MDHILLILVLVRGIKIFDLANSLSSKLKFKFKDQQMKKAENSIANNNFIINNLKFRNFVSLESFLKKKLNYLEIFG